jgi:hypothetical protein
MEIFSMLLSSNWRMEQSKDLTYLSFNSGQEKHVARKSFSTSGKMYAADMSAAR